MKKYVTIITTILCLMFAFGLNTQAVTYKNYKYWVKNGEVIITGFTDPDAVNVSIPTMIDGKKVTEIETDKDEWGSSIGAFSSCGANFISIIIPSSVTTIGDNAFYECRSLKSINIPKEVKTIGTSAFDWCKGLTSVTIPGSVSRIGNSVFMFCSRLKSVKLSKGLKTIGFGAFLWLRQSQENYHP